MAKQQNSRGGTTKVRFLMLEAEGNESDLAQIFSAIQSAVKPSTTVIQQRIISSGEERALVADNSASEDIAIDEFDDIVSPEPEKPKRNKPKISRRPTTPDVIDFDFDSDVSLADFAGQHPSVDTDVDRYLVIATWFKEYRGVNSITTAHVYTAYRVLSWPASIEDFGAILRYLKGQKLMISSGRGEYAINHLGLAKVKKLAGLG